jgi:hypothetical protein
MRDLQAERRETSKIPLVLFLFTASPAFSADDKTVGGHVGFGFPLVTN